MAAAKKRQGQFMAKAASAKDKEAKARFKLMAKSTMAHGTAAAKRLQNSADNAADSYARAIKNAAEEARRRSLPRRPRRACDGREESQEEAAKKAA